MTNISVKKALLIALATIGALSLVAFLAILLFLAIKKPFGIQVQNIPAAIIKSTSGNSASTYDHPLLTTKQESTLESLGVDTSKLPTTLTNAQIECAAAKLGEKRAREIEAGSPITANDYLKAQSCI